MKKKNKTKINYYLIAFLLIIILLLSKIDFSYLKSMSANIFIINNNRNMSKEVINSEIKELKK